MTESAMIPQSEVEDWGLPPRGIIGMACLILAEAAIFLIFVVAYLFYMGKSLSGPAPRDVLELPVFTTICLLSSSLTVHLAVSSLHKGARSLCSLWLAATVLLGSIFLAGTGMEWYHLIYRDGLTIRTNLSAQPSTRSWDFMRPTSSSVFSCSRLHCSSHCVAA